MIVIKPNAIPDNGDFARASAGTYIGLDRQLKTAASNAPRYEGGLMLLEAAASNLLQFSEDFRNTAEAGVSRPWTQFNDTGNAILVSQTTMARPDGVSGSVSKLTANTTGALQRQVQQAVTGLADGAVVSFSVFVQPGEVPGVTLTCSTKASAYAALTVDLTAGSVVSTSGAIIGSGVVALAGGWYRCWLAYNVGSGANTPGFVVQLKTAAGANYSGAVGDGLYLWGAQLEVSAAMTSYIPRPGTATASRAADVYSAGYIACGDLDGAAVGISPYVIAETDDAPLWSAATAYAVGDLVVRTQTHRIYRRLVAGTTAPTPETDATHWIEVGATQKYRPWDGLASNDSMLLAFYSLAISMPLSGSNALSLVGVRGLSVTVKITDGAGGAVIYSASKTLADDRYSYPAWPMAGSRWLMYDWHLFGLPSGFADAVAHIVITGGPSLTEYAAVREMYHGAGFDIGQTQGSPRIGIIDYSRKETDAFGGVSFVKRAFSRRMSCELQVPLDQFQKVFSLLADLRATMCQWVPEASGTYQPLMMSGWYRDFSISVAYPTFLLCTLEVESLAVDTLVEEL